MKRTQFLSQEINSCHKKSILIIINQFISQEINSCHKKSILTTRNQFSPQKINSYHKKLIHVTRNQYICFRSSIYTMIYIYVEDVLFQLFHLVCFPPCPSNATDGFGWGTHITRRGFNFWSVADFHVN